MNTLGIQLDQHFLKKALVRKRQGKLEIVSLKSLNLNDLPKNKSKFRGRVVSALPSKDFLLRSLQIPHAKTKHIEKAIAFQTSTTSYFKAEEIISVPVLDIHKKNTDALIFTVPKQNLKAHLDTLKKQQIIPDRVSTPATALQKFSLWKFPKLTDALLIDLGSEEIPCIQIEKGKLKKAHTIPKGIQNLLAALLEDRKKILLKKEIESAAKQIDLTLLKPALNPNLSKELYDLKRQINTALVSFTRGAETLPVIFTGRIDAFLHLEEFFIEGYKKDFPLTVEEAHFAISIGLALEESAKNPLQLLREEFFPKKNWAKLGANGLSLMFLSLVLSAALVGFGQFITESRMQKMLEHLPESKSKDPEERIDSWIDSIEKNNKEYPYLLRAPKVIDVLSWISSHPLLKNFPEDPLDIKSVQYELVSYPSIEESDEPFLAKVDLEFQCKNAMHARKFHEALRLNEALVDPDLEITWETTEDSYRTSFFLKNGGPYVP